MSRARVGVTIPIQLASWHVTTRALAIGRDLFLALQSLVQLVRVAIDLILSIKLHGTLRALPRSIVLVRLAPVIGELVFCLQFFRAHLTRKLVGLTWRRVEMLGVG